MSDQEILSLLENHSEFGHLGPFEFLYQSDGTPRKTDIRQGDPCYILKTKTGEIKYFYVRLDKTIDTGKKQQ